MALGSVTPYFGFQFCDNNGDPIAGGQVFYYTAGTQNKADTYSDSNRAFVNTNPVVLDANGRAPIFLGDIVYDCIIATATASDPPVGAEIIDTCLGLYQPSASNTADAIDEVAVAGQNLAQNESVYLADGSGGTTAGRWYPTDADNTYSSSGAKRNGFAVSSILSGQSGVVRVYGAVTGLAGLVAGTLYYASTVSGAITASAPTNALVVGVADSTTVLLTPGPLNSLSVTVAQLVALTAGAEGSKTTIDARLDVLMNADGTIVNPVTTQITQTAGTGSNTGVVPLNFDAVVVPVACVNGTETTAWTKSLTGNSLDVNGKRLVIRCWGSCAANANTKTLKVKFGGTTITVTTGTYSSAATIWYGQVIILRTGATTQAAVSTIQHNQSGGTNENPTVATPAETLSGAVTVSATIQGTSSSDIILTALTASLE